MLWTKRFAPWMMLAMTAESKNIEPLRPPTEEADLSGRKVLAVADRDSALQLLVSILEEFGFGTVRGSESVKSALSVLREGECDLLLLDLASHRLEEADLIRNALAIQPNLPIVVVSGYATIEWGVELRLDTV